MRRCVLLVDNLAPSDESKITNAKYIEGYEAGDIYTKKGLDDDSYVVYSCFTTSVRGLIQRYLRLLSST